MSIRDVKREFRELPLSVIDRPTLDARVARDPEKLSELANDIAKHGLIFPLVVVSTGDRYELVDGYRRYLALLETGMVAAPCLIYPTKETALEGVKYRANAFREDMSPAEEALFFNELFTHECGQDIERVALLVNKRVSYVDDRIQLLLGHAIVFEAVRARTITLGVARELNSCTDPDYVRYYLDCAIRGGATVAMVTGWIAQWRELTAGPRAPALPPSHSGPVAIAASFDPHYCVVCRRSDPRFLPEQVPIHTHCKLATLEPLLEAFHGQAEPEASRP